MAFTFHSHVGVLFRDNHVYRLLGKALISPFTESANSAAVSSASARLFSEVSSRSSSSTPGNSSAEKKGFHQFIVQRDDLRARLGSKSPVGEYASCLFETAAFMVANRNTIMALLQCGTLFPSRLRIEDSRKGKPNHDRAVNSVEALILGLLTMLSKYCPQSFENCGDEIKDWLECTVSEVSAAPSDSRQLNRSRISESKGNDSIAEEYMAAKSVISIRDQASTEALLAIVRQTAAYIWDTLPERVKSDNKSKQNRVADTALNSNNLCNSLFSWGARCSDPDASNLLLAAACALVGGSEAAERNDSRWAAYVPRRINALTSSVVLSIPTDKAGTSDWINALHRLSRNLFAMAAILRVGGGATIRVCSVLTDFVYDALLSDSSPLKYKEGTDDSEQSLHTLVRGAVKAWVSCAEVFEMNEIATAKTGTSSAAVEENAFTSETYLVASSSTKELMKALFDCLGAHGSIFGIFRVCTT
jgi:hypothetical protein